MKSLCTIDDFESLYEILSDPETMQHYPAPYDEERTSTANNKFLIH